MAKNTKAKTSNKKSKKGKKQQAEQPNVFKTWFSEIKKGETVRFIIGLVLMCSAIFLIVSFVSYMFTYEEDGPSFLAIRNAQDFDYKDIHNTGGILGLKAVDFFMWKGFGFPAIFIPIFMVLLALKLMKTHIFKITPQFINCAFLMIWSSTLLAFIVPQSAIDMMHPGGQHGINVCEFLNQYIGGFGIVLALAITMIIYFVYITSKTIDVLRKAMHVEKPVQMLADKLKKTTDDDDDDDAEVENEKITSDTDNPIIEQPATEPHDDEGPLVLDFGIDDGTIATPRSEQMTIDGEPTDADNEPIGDNDEPSTAEDGEDLLDIQFAPTADEEEADTNKDLAQRGDLSTPYDPKLDFENYIYPGVDLLKKYPETDASIDMQEQQANKERIITILRNFGVEISSIKATVGPTITLYEITPAKGVRIAKIRNLEDDIALSLSAIGIRIIAPIPGKGTIGIEVPNAKPKIVSMESVINSRKFQECDYELPIALGRTITNEIYIQDLAKMPHLLVAGATGQGKSVGLNAIISSLLFKKHPSELKFVLVDPKKVEFSIYSPLENNFMAEVEESAGEPVITEVEKVKHTLKSLCQEMDDRYMLLKSAGTRNIKEYNEKFKSRKLNPERGHKFLPYIVVIIDEYGDLIMVAGKEIEHPITRIAQLARAVGIHMVIATQRPTATIITGNIKANFPARMAFRVMATVDSRTILDQMGANQLVGRGDMLFLASGKQAERVQCAFIDTPEVEALNNFISEQPSPLYAYELPEVAYDDSGSDGDGMDENGPVQRYDSMFVDVARYVVNGQQGSTSSIQRTFSIGYNRAGRLMDQLERAKIVGPGRGSKPRDVLIVDEADLNIKLEALHLI